MSLLLQLHSSRYAVAFIAAGLVNLGLFLLMAFMVAGQQGGAKKIRPITVVDFVRLKHEQDPPRLKERQLPKKIIPPKQPPSMVANQIQPSPPKSLNPSPKMMPNIDLPLDFKSTGPYLGNYGEMAGVNSGSNIISVGEGDLIPLMRVPPQYPSQAAHRGLEGVVTVAFIVTKEGSVRDPEIIDSRPLGVFDAAALQAVRRWKFKSKQVDGQMVEQRATQKIEFKLER
ncbi:TonB-like protein [Candidatus Nitrosoglobus terrae]|uniref:Protein TonB n=1 Tax=Candidatus Nitrosoglobus terrae TaxID=1630141 RepID=A0A1Q2SKQ2_9GAMM|nr:energy transducer TonB [Candidatus Nitrosoglobus terrae]BAW79682.1 TonB-like protein [Candidatus Nitrosoglobus terrae]